MNTKENLTRVLINFSLQVNDIAEMPESSGTAYRIQLAPSQNYKTLQHIKKDIALSLNVKNIDIEIAQECAILKISE